MTTRILMCPPDHFTIDYVINPWMDGNADQLSLPLAGQQWRALRDLVSEHAEVVEIKPQPGFPDMVFTANAGVVYGDKAMASHFLPQERRGEEVHFKRWFADNGFELYQLPDNVGFEGAGDALLDRGGPWLWAGYGFRTEIEAHPHLAKWCDREVVSIKLTDPRYYHIDTCFCPLSDGYLIWHPAAFDAESRRKVEARVPAAKRVTAGDAAAEAFACNAVNIGDKVIVHQASSRLKRELGKHGFQVIESPLGEFLKAGGSAKCLTLKLTEPAA